MAEPPPIPGSDKLQEAKTLYEDLGTTIEEVGQQSLGTIKAINEGLAKQLADKQKLADIDASTLETLLEIEGLQSEAEKRVKEILGKKYDVLSAEEQIFAIEKEKQQLIEEANASIAKQIKYNNRLMKLAEDMVKLEDEELKNHEKLKDFKSVHLTLEKKSAEEIKKALGDYVKQATANKELAVMLARISTLLGNNRRQTAKQEEQYNKVDEAAKKLAQRWTNQA